MADDKKKQRREKSKSAEEVVQPDLSNQFAGPGGYNFSSLFQDPAEMLSKMFGIQQPTAQLGGGQNEMERLRMLQQLGQEDLARKQFEAETVRGAQVRPEELFQAQAKAQNPVGYAQENYQARLAADPWGPGGQFAGRGAANLYTPEEILASQGNTAQNQILRNRQPLSEEQRAKLAGVPQAQRANAGEFDPEELLRQNRIYSANRTYM